MSYSLTTPQTPPPIYEELLEPSYQELANEDSSDEYGQELADPYYGQEW